MTAPTRPKTPTQKAVGYAENKLGVHTVWEQAREALAHLRKAQGVLNSLRTEVREAEDDLRGVELNVIGDIQAEMPDASVAAVERAIKQHVPGHPQVVAARTLLRALEEQRNEAESTVSYLTSETRVLTARMEELGGYLVYLARAARNPNET